MTVIRFPAPDTATVVVRRQWNDYRQATYRFGDIRDMHWDNVSGGVRAVAPQYFIHGYVDCEGAVSGEVSHSGEHGPCPHSIKICVVAKDNDPAMMIRLVAITGPKPKRPAGPSKTRRALDAIGAAGSDGLTQAQLRALVQPSPTYETAFWRRLVAKGAIRSGERRKDGADRMRDQIVYRLNPRCP